MMAIDCEFQLSRAAAVYYTGEQVSGSISLRVSKKLQQLEALSISLSCRSTVSWSEPDNSRLPQIEHNDSELVSQAISTNFTYNKLHWQQTHQLLPAVCLPPGSTERCNFSFELPHDLPASCRLPLGATSYTLQVLLQRRGKHDKQFVQRLCVRQRIELLDLQPATSSHATLQLHLPRSVYAPGQRVAYQLLATTPASCCTRLYQSIAYRSNQPAAKTKRVLRLLDQKCDWTGALHLPLTVPIMTHLSDEPLEIAYYVEAVAIGGSCGEPLRLPLLVGTVAPPVDVIVSPTDSPALGFVNLALCENDSLLSSINQLLQSRSCSRESHASTPAPAAATAIAGYGEQLKLLRHQKKLSYVRLAWRYFHKTLLAAN